MNQQFYKFPPGTCTCILGDPYAGPIRVGVRKVSGTEAVLDAAGELCESQFVYVTLELSDGPSLAVSGLVLGPVSGGVLVQWLHSNPKEADRIDKALREYREQIRAAERSAEDVDSAAEDGPPETSSAPGESGEEEQGEEGRDKGGVEDGPEGRRRAVTPLKRRRPREGRSSRQSATEKRLRRKRKAAKELAAKKGGTGTAGAGGREAKAAPARDFAKSSPKESADTKETAPTRDREAAPGDSPPFDFPDAGKLITTGRKVVISDGKLDVSASVLRKSKTVRAAELASKVDMVQVLNMGTIKDLIQEAVDESIALLGPTLGENERKRLLEEAEEEFERRIEAFKAEKAGLEAQTRNLQQQLENAQSVLDEERQKVITANQFTVSDAGMIELEQRLGRMLDRAIKSGQVNDELEHDMRQVVARLLDDERDKIREQEQQAQNDKIHLLEKKIGRLANSLEQTEKERDRAQRRARALEASGGLPLGNIMQAGLDDDDPNRARKLDLLKEIVQFNRDIRENLEAEGRLPKKRARGRKPDDLEAPADDKVGGESRGDAKPGRRTERPQTEEEKLLSSLGIQRRDPQSALKEEQPEGPSADRKPIDDEDTVKVAVVASGDDVHPDDRPWEPREKSVGKTEDVEVKRLGG